MQAVQEIKPCQSCGEKFGCGAKLDNCWCTEVPLPPEIADDLKAKFQDCLCPECLAKFAEKAFVSNADQDEV